MERQWDERAVNADVTNHLLLHKFKYTMVDWETLSHDRRDYSTMENGNLFIIKSFMRKCHSKSKCRSTGDLQI